MALGGNLAALRPLLEKEFRRAIAGVGAGPVPLLQRAQLIDVPHGNATELLAEFPTGAPGHLRWDNNFLIRRYSVEVPIRLSATEQVRFSNECVALWSHAYEDHLLDVELREVAVAFDQACLSITDMTMLDNMRRDYERLRRNIQQNHHHRRAEPPTAVRSPDGLGTIDWRPGAVNYVGADFAVSPGLTLSDLQRAHRTLREQHSTAEMYEYLIARYYGGGRQSGKTAAAAEAKGLALLTEWLTPAQRAQYDKDKAFEVSGSHSGKRYRIKHGRQMNVVELDAKGNEKQGWCFLPQGGLVAGDCMLAQKIALETDERAALKVANKFEVGGSYDRTLRRMPVGEWLGS